MATDYSELRRLLEIGNANSQGPLVRHCRPAWNALPELLDEIETLRKGIDPWRRLCMRDKDRIAQLEAALRHLRSELDWRKLIDLVAIVDAALEGKERE